ncbi:hypothetical protein M5689_022598 [Euphorbia peplus]|nr:hypothetical protein M5689_022598 [Euphorbia peplus]
MDSSFSVVRDCEHEKLGEGLRNATEDEDQETGKLSILVGGQDKSFGNESENLIIATDSEYNRELIENRMIPSPRDAPDPVELSFGGKILSWLLRVCCPCLGFSLFHPVEVREWNFGGLKAGLNPKLKRKSK